MKLKKGILIHNQTQEGYAAISINSGTVLHTQQVTEAVNFQGINYIPQYENHARIAKRDWRNLNPQEISYIKSNGRQKDYDTVYLGDIPQQLKEKFQQLALAKSKSRAEVFEKFSGSEERTKELNSALNSFLGSLSIDKPFHFHCIGTSFPNLEMIACNTTRLAPNFSPQEVRYMGMHIDGTRQMTVHTAHKYGNRLSINIGNDTRQFLFVNLSVIQAMNMLRKKIDIEKNKITYTNIARFFFEHFPDYPIIKLQQKPYQYYIAPTDNCFHDGSTLGNTALDITMIYFGKFQH